MCLQQTYARLARPYLNAVRCVWLFAACLLAVKTAEIEEFCQWETFNATCPENELIVMQSARYGRMRTGRCLTTDYYVGCSADVLHYVDAICSGQRSCQISVPNPKLFRAQPCRRDLMAYFEASYICVQASSAEPSACMKGRIQAPGLSGSIFPPTPKSPGLSQCSWQIRGAAGQNVLLSLLSFDWRSSSSGNSCKSYLVIQEGDLKDNVSLCEYGKREYSLYQSRSNDVTVSFYFLEGNKTPTFMVQYKVLGCRDPPTPLNGWVFRDGDSALITCNMTGERLHIVCRGEEWLGDIRNCSAKEISVTTKMVANGSPSKFPFGLLVAVSIGIVLGSILGTLLLFVVFYWHRKYKREQGMKRTNKLINDPGEDYCEHDPKSYTLMEMRTSDYHSASGSASGPGSAGTSTYIETRQPISAAVSREQQHQQHQQQQQQCHLYESPARSQVKESSFADKTLHRMCGEAGRIAPNRDMCSVPPPPVAGKPHPVMAVHHGFPCHAVLTMKNSRYQIISTDACDRTLGHIS